MYVTMVYTTRENTLDRGAVTKSRGSGIFPGYHEPETPKRKRTSLLYNSPHVSRVYSATQNHDVSDSPVAWPTRNGSHMHNMHVQRFQDSNERTDKNPWLGLRRVSVKRGIAVYLFLKNAVLGLGLGLTLTLTLILNLNLTLSLNNPNHKTAFSKKNRPRPRPRVLLTPVCEENCGRGQAQSLWRFFFLPKSALFCDKIFGRPLFQWIEGEVDLIKIRYLHAVWHSAPFFFTIFRFPFYLRGGSSARWQQELLKDVEDDRTSQLLLGSHQSYSYNGFET